MPIKPGATPTNRRKKLYGFVSVAGTDDRQAGMHAGRGAITGAHWHAQNDRSMEE